MAELTSRNIPSHSACNKLAVTVDRLSLHNGSYAILPSTPYVSAPFSKRDVVMSRVSSFPSSETGGWTVFPRKARLYGSAALLPRNRLRCSRDSLCSGRAIAKCLGDTRPPQEICPGSTWQAMGLDHKQVEARSSELDGFPC